MKRTIAAFTAVIALVAGVSAHAVLLTASAPQTVDGQNFNFSLAAPLSDGTGGTFTITARGDYTLGFTDVEGLDFDFDGAPGNSIGPDNSTVITEFSSNDVLWTRTFGIFAPFLVDITGDGVIDILVDLDSGVNAGLSLDPFVSVEVDYAAVAVPEPGALSLLGLGLLALGTIRRLRNP